MILKGKLISIPIKNLTDGMQIWHELFGIGKIINCNETYNQCLVKFDNDKQGSFPQKHNDVLKTLVIEGYDEQIPLKYDNWKMAIKYNQIDNNNLIDFEIETIIEKCDCQPICETCNGYQPIEFDVAKINLKFINLLSI